MKIQLNKVAVIAGLAIATALPSLAQPYYIAGDGITPNWTTWEPGATPMSGGPTVYTVTLPTLANSYHQFKASASNWVSSWPNNNIKAKGDANGSNTFYYFPGSTIDGWLPIANRVGYDDPGNMTWEIIGAFTGWTTGTNLNSIGNGVYSNSIVVATAGSYEFKFRTQGTWDDVNFGLDFGNGSGNASFTTTNSPQTVPVRLDLPNGRWLVGDLAPPPVTNYVVFQVDMSVESHWGRFNPATDVVCVSGAFNGWPGTGPSALFLTNVPTVGGNTNIYYATNIFVGAPSSFASEYKYTDTNPNVPFGYEPRAANRSISLLPTNGTLVLPVVYWGDYTTNDYLPEATLVTFKVNMTGRVNTNGVVFDPNLYPNVYINGNFLTNSWISSWNPITLQNNLMTENPLGSTNYEYSYMVPKGHLVRTQYKYGFDDNVGGLDNEAPSGQDHERYIRTTATGSYVMPNDTFGIQYHEPSFGELSVGAPSGGTVPIKWLGRPGVKLQSATTLPGSWSDYVQTDGTNWSLGTSTTNGLLSTTNWPAASGNQFFRLIKQ